ncbi:Plant-specific TFIIB-related protein PTF2 [Camellia lanceoleosa]|uniref:Plant-specific TFIIB-related protein PTF2 n=1 Tax=Camellia lanceoleosa TaxID=1840588 RepID=A0ACC0H3J9_9ERIC|nr:Plant-specific TFIIB-related protein PTF2 [Camellia lanceoleosa]
MKNAQFVIQYMELKSMSKHGEKRKSLEHVGFDLDGLVRDCLSKEVEFGMDSYGMENDSQYFEVEDPTGSPGWSIDDLEKLKISHECLSLLYSKLSNEVSNANSVGCLAYQRRREKIKAAKVRIDKIMCPPNANSGDRDDDLCILECLNGGNKRRRKKMAIVVDWEDFIIETLLLHRVEEEEIEKGHYNTLLDLHVFNSGKETVQPLKKGDKRCTWQQQIPPTISICTKFGCSKRKKYSWNKTVGANIENQLQTMGADMKQLCQNLCMM